jgi:putative component of membrane protein insertase Oxa1/YidC/SpoIIIJ protein YidD
MKLLSPLPPSSCHFLSLMSRYSHHPVLQHTAYVLPLICIYAQKTTIISLNSIKNRCL